MVLQAQGPELQFPGAWEGTSNAKNYLRDMVVLKTYPTDQVVLTQKAEMKTTGEMDIALCLSDV